MSTAISILLLLIFAALVFLLVRFLTYRMRKLAREQEARHQQDSLLAEKKILDLKNEKLQADMVYRDKELANQTMALIDKNRFLKRINDDLQNIQDFIVNDTARKKVETLKRQIRAEIDIEQQNKIFETSFDAANEKLFSRLKEHFPDLTPYDLRLCAFIRMNLSTKEIAAILNISYRGAEVSRYRLRKKLQLTREENLSSFLAGF